MGLSSVLTLGRNRDVAELYPSADRLQRTTPPTDAQSAVTLVFVIDYDSNHKNIGDNHRESVYSLMRLMNTSRAAEMACLHCYYDDRNINPSSLPWLQPPPSLPHGGFFGITTTEHIVGFFRDGEEGRTPKDGTTTLAKRITDIVAHYAASGVQDRLQIVVPVFKSPEGAKALINALNEADNCLPGRLDVDIILCHGDKSVPDFWADIEKACPCANLHNWVGTVLYDLTLLKKHLEVQPKDWSFIDKERDHLNERYNLYGL